MVLITDLDSTRLKDSTENNAQKTTSFGAKPLTSTEIVQQDIVPALAAEQRIRAARTPEKTQAQRAQNTSDAGVSGTGIGDVDTENPQDHSKKAEPKTPLPITQPSSVTQETSISFNFEDNILTQFDNMQYNFRLYMASETTTHETLPFDDIIVIAETGSTGFNIIDLQMDTIISPSKATKNSFATNVVIKIIEPFGSSLLDYIRNSAAELGVLDHRRVPIWLDLRFKGYTDGFDESYQGGELRTLEDQTRSWRLRVKNVDIEMTKGGTEYTMHLIAQDEIAMEDSARLLESDIHIDAVTLGDFFLSLSIRLNKFSNYNTVINSDGAENIRTYRFALPGDPVEKPQKTPDKDKSTSIAVSGDFPPMRTWAIRGKTSKKSVKSATFKKPAKFEQQEDDGGSHWRITFKKGTSIESIIQQVIGSTEEGASLLLFGEINKKISSNKDRNPAIPSIAFVVDPNVFLLSYNKIAKSYNIEITYNIRPYKTFIPTVTREHIEAAQSKKLSKERIKAKNKISNIKKIYNYMFTGENTEILDYKVELNSTWFISLPIFRGQDRVANALPTRDDSKQDPTILGQSKQVKQDKISPLTESIQALKKRIVTLQEIQDSGDTFSQTTADDIASSQLEIQARSQTQIPLRSGLSAVNTTAHGVAERRLNIDTDVVRPPPDQSGNVQPSTTIIGRTAKNEQIRKDRRKLNSNKSATGSIFFAEDFDKFIEKDEVNKAIDENGKIINIGSQISPSTSTGESNIEGVIDEDRSFFSVAMNQIYGFKGQLIVLDLEIRGDPYWLGEPNSFKRLTNANGFDDHTKADSLIVLTFKFPVALDDGGDRGRAESYNGTGLYDLKRQENGFNGIYYITKVENSFAGGKFTQRLTGYVDPLTKEQDLLNGLENNGV